MKKERIVLDFVRFPVAQKVEFGRGVITQMRGNPKFPSPDVSLDELETRTNLLESRSVASLSGGKESTALAHQAEEDWTDFMRKMARYAERIADGDGTVILNAGFNIAKQHSPGSRPEFSVELGEKPGSVELRRQAIEGAKSYIWQYYIGETPPLNDNGWITIQVTSKASVDLSGLNLMCKYWFRSAAVTVGGTTAYTQPVMQIII